MNIISRIKGWLNMIFKNRAEEEFQIKPVTSSEMENIVERCVKIYKGNPDWIDEDDHINTINFAKSVCSEVARLAMLGTKITIDGSPRATWLQDQINAIYFKIREWVEYGCAYGTIILKPNGKSVDMLTPNDFMVTDQSNGEITSIVFVNREISESGKKWYTRLEYHRYVNDVYVITNKCYVGDTENDRGKPVSISETPWNELSEEVYGYNIKSPLYGVLRMPHANNVDIDSPLGLPIFWDAIEELKDLDIAYSRNAKEIFDSKRTILLDSDRLLPSGGKVSMSTANFNSMRESMGLPDMIKNVYGSGREDFYQEINPQLNTDVRLSGIDALLSQIGYKIGFANGYFVFDETQGIQTATGVEANQQRTIQFIKDVRDKVESCLERLIYAMNAFADNYNLAPLGTYEVTFDFGDITYNREEDRLRWWGYVTAGKIEAWRYFVKFEGFSEEEAKEMVKEAKPKEPRLFGSEE